MKQRQNQKYWRVNHNIHAPKVRVIDEGGKQVGVVELKKALELAQKAGLDLVEIAPNAKPPVTKIVDLGKFKYEQEKKAKKEKRKTKAAEVKEIRLTPFIAKHDYENRLNRIKEFLAEKHKVRVVIKFKGRQLGSKKFGYDLIENVITSLGENIVVDTEPKFVGRHLIVVISPTAKGGSNAKTKNEKVTDKKV